MKILQGGFFEDHRGIVSFNNLLDLNLVKRMYVIENIDKEICRAWQGHQIEKRWFVAVNGLFEIKVVKIDDFKTPSDKLESESFVLKGKSMDSLYIEEGHATSIQALEPNSKLVVFSDYNLGEIKDDYKFDSQKWKH
ncbi:WxcM-like domain-containing protein [Chryseobacterium taiwanense]|uniref:Sugar 3,4-ketoisomerase QdtA cupin domain-containing protein n=1 Tax=Chryseobacterium taiwanense TaxID=363331 RepID=A0A0B4E9W4_9FLAO|nr:WxcM-like domain-containing protein [Chryseobacterium taiwanense]KIC63428.1 hypothetical protein RM51_07055 [Chryseobacterium taiwanense]